jgi:hypothetical protein
MRLTLALARGRLSGVLCLVENASDLTLSLYKAPECPTSPRLPAAKYRALPGNNNAMQFPRGATVYCG